MIYLINEKVDYRHHLKKMYVSLQIFLNTDYSIITVESKKRNLDYKVLAFHKYFLNMLMLVVFLKEVI